MPTSFLWSSLVWGTQPKKGLKEVAQFAGGPLANLRPGIGLMRVLAVTHQVREEQRLRRPRIETGRTMVSTCLKKKKGEKKAAKGCVSENSVLYICIYIYISVFPGRGLGGSGDLGAEEVTLTRRSVQAFQPKNTFKKRPASGSFRQNPKYR